jgi:hypothetical protein
MSERVAGYVNRDARDMADRTAAAMNAGETGARARVITAIAWRRAVDALGAICRGQCACEEKMWRGWLG